MGTENDLYGRTQTMKKKAKATPKKKAMPKKKSAPKKKPATTKSGQDKIAKEFREIKSLGISTKKLVWGFALTSTNQDQLQKLTSECIDLLTEMLGKRCRASIETTKLDHKKSLVNIYLKIPAATPVQIRKLDRGMARCVQGTRVKYNLIGFQEETYERDSWKTLGTVLQAASPKAESGGELDCQQLRFDGLYYHDLGGGGDYLRFYPDGKFVAEAISGEESVENVAKWLRREHEHATVGTYTLKAKSFQGEYQVESEPDEDPIIIKLKAKLTKQGLKVRTWSSYSNEESDEVYLFHCVKLR